MLVWIFGGSVDFLLRFDSHSISLDTRYRVSLRKHGTFAFGLLFGSRTDTTLGCTALHDENMATSWYHNLPAITQPFLTFSRPGNGHDMAFKLVSDANFWGPSAPFVELDPLEWVSGPSLARK